MAEVSNAMMAVDEYERKQYLALGGARYRCIRADSLAVYAKNDVRLFTVSTYDVMSGFIEAMMQRGEGFILAYAGTYAIVSTYCSGMFATVCAEATEALGGVSRVIVFLRLAALVMLQNV